MLRDIRSASLPMRVRLALLGCASVLFGCGLLIDPAGDAGVHDAGVRDAGASAEECNGLDDDGDGLVDEAPADPSFGEPCYEGPDGLRGVGACVEGAIACVDGALACEGWGEPSLELCNGVDDDCDGALLPEEGTVGCDDWIDVPGATRVLVEVAPPTLDLALNIDTTGSMGTVLTTLRSELSSFIVPGVRALFPDAAFAVSTFDDFPVSPFGSAGFDIPFVLHQRVTTRVADAQGALDGLVLHSGADGDESGIEALWQLMVGDGRTWPDGFGGTGSIPPADCEAGFDAAAGHGLLGGACFRDEALPVVVQFTDARSHDAIDYPFAAAEARATIATARERGARLVGMWSQFTSAHAEAPGDLRHLLGMALATDAVVPPCAFAESAARASGTCASGMCCTGIDGAGVAPRAAGCPLVFDVTSTATGLEQAIVDAVRGLTNFATFDLSVELNDVTGDPVDARCFVQSVEVVFVEAPTGTCTVTPTEIDSDGDGLVDTVEDATPGVRVSFEVVVDNRDARDVDGDGDRSEACAGAAGTYPLELRILPTGSAALLTRTLTIVVP